jgi:phosphate transport system permease protein
MLRSFPDYVFRSYKKRKAMNIVMCTFLIFTACLALLPLIGISWYVVSRGLPGLNLSFFTELPKPVGEVGGGMANAIVGTLTLIGLASLIGIPWGVFTGIYLSEYGFGKRAALVRFSVDMLSSVPSIIIGLFVYTAIVLPMGRFSAIAGGVALGILMVPTVAKVTEELLKMVPTTIREAGLALGLPRWRVILQVVLKGSVASIMTGVMLGIARVSGETAPLLFTALGNRYWQSRLDQPISSLPVQIYNYAISPYEDWHRKAWAGALILVVLVFILNMSTRLIISPFSQKGEPS